MLEKRTAISVEDALKLATKNLQTGSIEEIELKEAHGRVLAEDLKADHDVPSFDRSPYDGFAIRAEDTHNAKKDNPSRFKVVAEIGAGSIYEKPLNSFEAVRIMTGAKIPDQCNAVVMLEQVKESNEEGQAFFDLDTVIDKHHNISFQGEDTKKGTVLLKKGTTISPGVIATLATFGYAQVWVQKKPVIGVIATGSELLEVDQPLENGKIRNSNAYMIYAQIQQAGGIPFYFGQFSDDFEVCLENMKKALMQVDFLITTGGVSVGDYDLLPDLLKALDAEILFNKVQMRPGSVTTVAEINNKKIFALSGNPSACFVGFELFTKAAINAYLGIPGKVIQHTSATLGVDFKKANPFDRFIRGEIHFEEGQLLAYPAGLDKSNSVISLAKTNALIHLPGGTSGYLEDDEVNVILLKNV
ncbi:gephyrin-like molybdotransferase Glp [Saliterribacillus persicus]|uniref:Molybdopterin molybdenumtransferase n=1 Tax=Saliterribacillus persicus TaxID=930114 RepID=A0A368XIF2_9BACI|nr:gephyrin-like molybdotransferase Glp [Saliterribacillus persicus]RCW66956.1 molybdopterin molybdochelatase [Saliterribacillus persicus]